MLVCTIVLADTDDLFNCYILPNLVSTANADAQFTLPDILNLVLTATKSPTNNRTVTPKIKVKILLICDLHNMQNAAPTLDIWKKY